MIIRTMANPTRGADVLVAAMKTAGVKYIFTLSGNQIMSVFDATIGTGIELIHVRQEAAAVHMADAWGRLTGQPGVALVTAGPGFTNTLTAMYVAAMAESPLVVLSGCSPAARDGHGAFQEMPQARIAGEIAKASWTASDPAGLGYDLVRAMRLARSGRPGPVHIALPGDILSVSVNGEAPAGPTSEDAQPVVSLLDRESADAILGQVAEAKRPLIVGGPMLAHHAGRELLEQLEETTGVPVVAMGSPRGINDPGLGAFAEVLAEADLLVLVGRKPDVGLRFAEPPVIAETCRLILVDPEQGALEQFGGRLAETQRLSGSELADPVPTLERLIQRADDEPVGDPGWRTAVREAVAFRPSEWAGQAADEGAPLHPVQLARAVHENLAVVDESVFISDGGEFGQWSQAVVGSTYRLINGPSGSIGSGVPFALAARLACPEARIISTVGDGTVGFHAMEWDTAVRCNLPLVIVVGNDACWNAEYQIQLQDYGPDRLVGCELAPTRYDEVCRALGGWGERVERAADLPGALERAVASGQPACVDVRIARVPAPIVRR